MIVGDISHFAISSCITQPFARDSLLALGSFQIIVDHSRFGVDRPDATMLACSFDAVQERILERGQHTAPFAGNGHALEIADDFRNAFYNDSQSLSHNCVSLRDFADFVEIAHGVWAPDGDEAFDDGSYVLQFDVDDRVRVIAFKTANDGTCDPATLRDKWLGADEFYRILETWAAEFQIKRYEMLKSALL